MQSRISGLESELEGQRTKLAEQEVGFELERGMLRGRIEQLEKEMAEIPLTGEEELKAYFRELRVREMREVARLKEAELRLQLELAQKHNLKRSWAEVAGPGEDWAEEEDELMQAIQRRVGGILARLDK